MRPEWVTEGLSVSPAVGAPSVECDDVAFRPGALTCLIGPSGSGKTTALRALAGLSRPSGGRIMAGGEDLWGMRSRRRARFRRQHVRYVPQDLALVTVLSALENIRMAASLWGVDSSPAVASTLLSKVGLDGLGSRRLTQLSGGQRQRLAIARALLPGGGIIIADEPSSALDEAATAGVMDALREASSTRGVPVILTSHDENVWRLCDERLTFSDGRFVST